MMLDTILFSQFEMLRARVESVLERPGAIMVTSARAGDGKSLAAYGLAERMAAAGRRVAVVTFSSRVDVDAIGELAAARAFPIFSLGDEDAPNALTPEQIKQFVVNARRKHDYVIVDGRPLLESRACIVLSSSVDGVLVALRHGRAVSPADSMVVEALESGGSRVIGVVSAQASDIAAFEWPVYNHPADALVTVFDLQGERSSIAVESVALNISKRADAYA